MDSASPRAFTLPHPPVGEFSKKKLGENVTVTPHVTVTVAQAWVDNRDKLKIHLQPGCSNKLLKMVSNTSKRAARDSCLSRSAAG